MTRRFDAKALNAFFQEVEDQLKIQLQYFPDDPKFPIQLKDAPMGISKDKCLLLLNFIKGQIDLRDNEIGKIYTTKANGKFLFDITHVAADAIAEVYALSLFIDPDEEENPEG